jgi:type II secretory pathway pseudopilin PulG
MKRVISIVAIVAAAACASVAPPRMQERAAQVRERTAAMDAATQRIVVVEGTEVPGHPQYETLGAVRGYCEKTPKGDAQIISGDSMKQSAVRKYGDRVDAIVQAGAYFASNTGAMSAVGPGTNEGHWICSGTAVSFGPPQAPAAAPAIPEPEQ